MSDTIPIPNEMIVNSVDHAHAGNAWAVVECYQDEWARVVKFNDVNKTVDDRAFLVWTKKLTSGVPIHPDCLSAIEKVRKNLASGDCKRRKQCESTKKWNFYPNDKHPKPA